MIVALFSLLLPLCPTEDSTNCIWRADLRGNKAGHSFISIGTFSLQLTKE